MDFERFLSSKILCESSDDLSQIVFFIIVMAIGLIGNLTKAKAQKRTSRTGKNRSETRTRTQRTQAEKTTPPPVHSEANSETRSQAKKYYTPGGFAEIFKQDRTLEHTLNSSSKKRPKKRPVFVDHDTYPTQHEEDVIDRNLESMGQLESLQPDQQQSAVSKQSSFKHTDHDENEFVPGIQIDFEQVDDLAKAMVYSEIFSKPVGLR